MDIDLSQIKRYDACIQYLVFGFVRNAESLLQKNSSHCNITDLITYMIIAYYQNIEYFKYYNTSKITASNGDLTVTKTSTYSHHTCYGSRTISFDDLGIHHWTLKMTALSGGGTIVGIDEANRNHINTNFASTKVTKYYGYAAFSGEKYSSNGQNIKHEYYGASTYTEGDIVHIILDLDSKSILFGKNNAKPVKADNIEKTNVGYCLAIWICDEDDSISLLSYKYTNVKPNYI